MKRIDVSSLRLIRWFEDNLTVIMIVSDCVIVALTIVTLVFGSGIGFFEFSLYMIYILSLLRFMGNFRIRDMYKAALKKEAKFDALFEENTQLKYKVEEQTRAINEYKAERTKIETRHARVLEDLKEIEQRLAKSDQLYVELTNQLSEKRQQLEEICKLIGLEGNEWGLI